MESYLIALGSWNLLGSLMMIGFFNEAFGRKMLNDWTKMFTIEFKLDYWSKFWLGWAIGLNIFFGMVNIFAAFYSMTEMKVMIICFDLFAYAMFICLAIWGIKVGRCASGIYSALFIFVIWIGWGIFTFMYK